MNWKDWKTFVPWTPLSATGFSWVQCTDTIFSLGPNAFVVAQRHNAALEDGGGPYVTLLVWAPSLGSVRRVIDLEIEADEGEVLHPPVEMLPRGSRPAYASVLDAALREFPGNVLEHASYRIAGDGAFVCRSVSAGPFQLYFRHPSGDQDPPFCVVWKGSAA
ncbi:MAG TPA: hypothetical protein VFO89_08705 [Thermoanaerobaculia bacterium]|nr:hypothetical protein [Thermoanaerobaculia bacterium]